MKCPACNNEYDDDFEYCPYCGAGLDADMRFCPNCGKPFEEGKANPHINGKHDKEETDA